MGQFSVEICHLVGQFSMKLNTQVRAEFLAHAIEPLRGLPEIGGDRDAQQKGPSLWMASWAGHWQRHVVAPVCSPEACARPDFPLTCWRCYCFSATGWGTWIRTKAARSRAGSSTAKLSPSGALRM